MTVYAVEGQIQSFPHLLPYLPIPTITVHPDLTSSSPCVPNARGDTLEFVAVGLGSTLPMTRQGTIRHMPEEATGTAAVAVVEAYAYRSKSRAPRL